MTSFCHLLGSSQLPCSPMRQTDPAFSQIQSFYEINYPRLLKLQEQITVHSLIQHREGVLAGPHGDSITGERRLGLPPLPSPFLWLYLLLLVTSGARTPWGQLALLLLSQESGK